MYAFFSNRRVFWPAYQVIRTLDLPLFNVIERMLMVIPIVRSVEISGPVVQAMTHTLVGGAMWAAIAAMVTLTSHWVAHLRDRRRKRGG
jgi:hypothetical protein